MSAGRIEALKKRPTDLSDIPEITKEQFAKAYFRNSPESRRAVKKSLTICIDADILEAFKVTGEDYQSRMNDILRKAIF